MSTVDVVIVGAGPAGLATALWLNRGGYRAIVLERTNLDTPRIGEHLAPEGVAALEQLGIADGAGDGHLACYGVKSAWGSNLLQDNDYIYSPFGHGLNLDRPAFDLWLAEHAQRRGVAVLCRALLHDRRWTGKDWLVTFSQNGKKTPARAKFLVDATGRGAAIARSLGARRVAFDQLVGLVGFARMTSPPPDHSVLVEAQPGGWWYAAPLSGGRAVAAYMTDTDLLRSADGHLRDVWHRQFDQSTHTRTRLTGCEPTFQIHVRPAQSQCLDRVVGAGWLAVGDAAMSFDPLSSAGISKGLSWGGRAAKAVGGFLRDETQCLDQYEQEMKAAFRKYMLTRMEYYRQEIRWAALPFWQRRHQPLPE